jgi:hypothetical protein
MDSGIGQGQTSQFKETVHGGWFWLSMLRSTGRFGGDRDQYFSVIPGSKEA